MSKKRRREVANIDVQLIEIYEDLASFNEDIRLKAAIALVSKLSPDHDPSSQDIEKALNRLIKGLSSGRKAARVGFSIALTELLAQLLGPDRKTAPEGSITIEKLLEVLKSQTHPVGSIPGQEERDHHFGRLFGAEAIIKSSILFQSLAPSVHWSRILDLILELAKKKPWLREECGWIIYGGLQFLSTKFTNQAYAQVVIDKLVSHGLVKTPEGVAIWLSIQTLFPTVRLPMEMWRHEDPLNAKETTTLAKVLKEASTPRDVQNGEDVHGLQKGMWNSKLHFAWDVVLAELYGRQALTGGNSARSQRMNFADFWNEVVDNSLFSNAASNERKCWGFLLLCKVLETAPEHIIAVVYSKNLKRSLINQLAGTERYIHQAATKSLKVMHARVERNPDLAAVIATSLITTGAMNSFAQLMKTKTIEKLLIQASVPALQQIILLFQQLIERPGTQEQKTSETQRRSLADQLLSLLRIRKINPSSAAKTFEPEPWVEQILYLFTKCGYFAASYDSSDPKHSPEPPISPASQDMFRSRLSSCLTHLLSTKSVTQPDYPYLVVRRIQQQEQTNGEDHSLLDADKTVRKALLRAWKTVERIHKKETGLGDHEEAQLRASQLLYSLTILQVYNGDADAVSILDELRIFSDKVNESEPAIKSDDTAASEVIVEVLLSLISKPSTLFQKLAQQVFKTFAAEINDKGLESMLAALESSQQEIFDQNEEEEEEEEDGNSQDESISDVEELDEDSDSSGNGDDDDEAASDVSEDSATSNEEASDDEDKQDVDNDNELAAFNAKLADALGTYRADADMDDGEEETTDDDMTDEQMMAIEPHLTKVFQERKKVTSKKQDRKDAKETVIKFKSRVLELLEIYIKQQHGNSLALNIILPLLRLIRSNIPKHISEKASTIIREYSRLCKGNALPTPAAIDPLWHLLRSIHAEAMQQASHAHSSACSQASLLLVKILVGLDREHGHGAVAMYSETRGKALFHKGCDVKPAFFADWNNWCTSAGRNLQR
ncbi:MAG: DNA-directed DNA polymerase [Pycnora praestabilis]|nr:MAG: DNA-directed DNA polymerase [Pycnora praestabilis]